MAKHTYKPANGSRLKNDDAQKIGETIEKIEDDGESVTPKALIERARPKASPIHHLYEWDDRIASEQYRMGQARGHIRGICVVTVVTAEPKREFHSVHVTRLEEPQRAYVRREVVVASDDLLTQKSRDLYVRLKTVVADVRNLGLDKQENWRRIIGVIENNPPAISLPGIATGT